MLDDDAPQIRCTPNPIGSGEAFLKALDDPPDRRNHIVVVTHSALTNSLKDKFVKLALVYFAIHGLNGADDLRARVAKWSDGKAGIINDVAFSPHLVRALLAAPPEDWRRVWERNGGAPLEDAPVPEYLRAAVEKIDLGGLRQVIRELPKRSSANIESRLRAARQQLQDATQASWKPALAAASVQLPLVIVDEAHALKNGGTQISRLFTPLSDQPGDGALSKVFERMLLMTATPFELGDNELINLLSRLHAVRPMHPAPAEPLQVRLEGLKVTLAAARRSANALDAAWSRLNAADAAAFDSWSVDAVPPDDVSPQARAAWRDAVLAAHDREAMHTALAPWVIRHERPHRRDVLPGDAIITGIRTPVVQGLNIPESAMLPFLLAARAQAIPTDACGSHARPLYAYGLASSYEAYLRLNDGEVVDTDHIDASTVGHIADESGVHWYRSQIHEILKSEDQRQNHPKVSATVDRAMQLWKSGQKCLVFCWYLRTTSALEKIVIREVDAYTANSVTEALAVSLDDVDTAVRRLVDRLLRTDTRGHDRIHGTLEGEFFDVTGDRETAKRVADVAIRNLRAKETLVRYTRLAPDMNVDAILAGLRGDNPAGVDLIARWRRFAKRIGEGTRADRESVFEALIGDDGGTGSSLASVRRADSTTAFRDRLIKVFNTPFAPDILVASSVMGEGVDLHQECRHVIHHDLDWNPSKLEQRTGRLDRIGALAECEGNIQVYQPFLAGTHDEKMYRVVTDRASWFDIVMGRSGGTSEHVTDDEELRIPLHPRVADAMAMDFEVR
ncbi:MAG: DEAD/DEAH box helicase [Gordonia sp. (in: high G+C Gram-positive bacteria)]